MDEINTPQEQKPFPYAIFGFGGGITVISLFVMIGGGASFLLGKEFTNKNMLLLSAIQSFLLIFLPALVLCLISPMKLKKILRLNKPQIGHIVVVIAAAAPLQLFSGSYLALQDLMVPDVLRDSYRELQIIYERLYGRLMSNRDIVSVGLSVIGAAAIPAISEESLFRGFMQKSAEQSLKPIPALLITAGFFAVFHFNPINIVPFFGVGLFLGILAYLTNNLFVPMAAHFSFNAFTVITFSAEKFAKFEDRVFNGTESQISALGVGAVLLVSIGLLAGVLYYVARTPAPETATVY